VPAVAVEDHSSDIPTVGAERDDRLAGPSIPDLYVSVIIPRDEVAAVRAERHGEGSQRGREREDFPSVPCVPDLDGVRLTIDARRGDALAVGVPILRPPESELNATPRISSVCSLKVRISWPSFPQSGVASQKRMVPSALAEARRQPSGLNATHPHLLV